MKQELAELNRRIESLELLDIAVSQTEFCRHAPQPCQLQSVCAKARPAISSTISHLRRVRHQMRNQEDPGAK